MHALKSEDNVINAQVNDGVETLTLLFVGTDTETVESFTQVVRAMVKVVVKDNAMDAMRWIEEGGRPNLILSEFELAGMSGLTFHDLIKVHMGDDMPAFVLLGEESTSQEMVYRAYDHQVDDVIEKPTVDEAVGSRLDFLIKHKRDLRVVSDKKRKKEFRIHPVKRAFDILVSGTALLLASPLLILIVIAIKLDSKGPVFYSSKRVGSGYRVFDFYKFRSMKVGADHLIDNLKHLNQYGEEKEAVSAECPDCKVLEEPCSPLLKIDGEEICEKHYFRKKASETNSFVKFENDPRITKLGNFLRNSSIDEIPQLVNILKGDMSLVGNRPLPLYEAELLTTDNWSTRFNAPAGLTGLWQVEKRGRSEMSEDERKQLDNEYARNYSLWGDIKLILKTIPILLQKGNV